MDLVWGKFGCGAAGSRLYLFFRLVSQAYFSSRSLSSFTTSKIVIFCIFAIVMGAVNTPPMARAMGGAGWVKKKAPIAPNVQPHKIEPIKNRGLETLGDVNSTIAPANKATKKKSMKEFI